MSMVHPEPDWSDSRGIGHAPWWLWPLWAMPALLYRGGVALRGWLFRMGLFHTYRAPVAVISVGNLLVGGTGKTPMVDYLLQEAKRAGRRPACLTRGYGRRSKARLTRLVGRAADGDHPAGPGEGGEIDPRTVGDEPAMLARRHPGIPIYIGAHRRESARLAPLWDGVDLLLLDDGYQHLSLHRDLNIALVDAIHGLGNGRMLPLGPLREPLAALSRADAVLITKANLGDSEALQSRLARLVAPGTPIWRCDYLPTQVTRLDGRHRLEPGALAGREVSVICAIAQPAGLVRTLADLGATVTDLKALPDHHDFSGEELAALEASMAREIPSSSNGPPGHLWLMTEKDAVKFRGRVKAPRNFHVLEMGMVPEPDARKFFFDFIRSATLKSL